MSTTKQFTSFLIILLISGFTSCSNQEETDQEPDNKNKLTLNNTTYELSNGFVEDYGGYDIDYDGEVSHYRYVFTIGNGSLTVNGENYSLENGNMVIRTELHSAVTPLFWTREFRSLTGGEFGAIEIKTRSFFHTSIIIEDDNSDSRTFYRDIDGWVNVTRNSETNFTLEFNMTLQQGLTSEGTYSDNQEKVNFSYTGEFPF